MQKIDGITRPRSFNFSLLDDKVVIQYRKQMANEDEEKNAIPWQPLSGPTQFLKDVDLDHDRLRLVPKKLVPTDGVKLAIDTLADFSSKYMPKDCYQVLIC